MQTHKNKLLERFKKKIRLREEREIDRWIERKIEREETEAKREKERK